MQAELTERSEQLEGVARSISSRFSTSLRSALTLWCLTRVKVAMGEISAMCCSMESGMVYWVVLKCEVLLSVRV